MTVTPINAAAAVLLDSRARGTTPLVPISDIDHPELARLLAISLERGSVPADEYAKAQKATGWSKRHIQRKLADLRTRAPGNTTPARPRFELTDHHKQTILACGGNVRLAYDQLAEAGETLPAYATFWRRFNELPAAVQAYARRGAEGLVEFWLYPPYEAPERNAVWQADHFELPNDVIADGCTTTVVKPWLTVFEDDRTRKIMGWSLTAEPGRRADADVVCATIAAAVTIRLEDDIEVGGVPHAIRWDNDRSFTAGAVTQLGTAVGFECHAVPPYSGHMKGKVERLGRRIQDQFCALQPGYTHGPATYSGRNPFRDTPLLTADQMRERLAAWFADYDRSTHQSLGRSPLEAWAAEATPLRRADDDDLRSALLVAPRPYKVHPRKGIHWNGRWWLGAGLLDVVGQSVEIRHPIGEAAFIEVYHRGRWHCTAWPAKGLTDEQKQQIWSARADMYAEVRALHDQARQARVDADIRTDGTDATPSMASVPAHDPLAADPDNLYALLARAAGTDEGDQP